MHKRVLVLTTSALILAYGAFSATAQDRMTPQPDQQYTQHHPTGQAGAGTSGQQGGMMGPGTMGMMGRGMMGGGMMGSAMGPMGPDMMMRIIFSLMDGDGDGTISLPEFQAAHERIFKAMDANKDGRLTLEEMQAFMQGTTRSVPRQ